MYRLKKVFKKNTHNSFFKALAGFGRSLNRLYENRNHDINCNGELSVIKKLSQTNPSVLIDGGANIGNYSKILSHYNPHATVYAFEPVKDTFDKLVDQTKEHKNIIPRNEGFFSENLKKTINLYNSHTLSSLYDIEGVSYQPEETTEIKLIKGDDFVSGENIEVIDFLKLDLEGAEFDALEGFENCLKQKRIKVIQFEYGYINITTKKLLIDYYNFFEALGYKIGKVFPKTVEFRKYETKYEDFLGPNFIAVDKNETHIIDLLKNK